MAKMIRDGLDDISEIIRKRCPLDKQGRKFKTRNMTDVRERLGGKLTPRRIDSQALLAMDIVKNINSLFQDVIVL